MNPFKQWRWLVALGAVFVPAVALGTVTLPFTFTSGTLIKAGDVNANFTALKTAVDQLQAQKPVVLNTFVEGPVTVDGTVLNGWLAGVGAITVSAGSKVHVSVALLRTPGVGSIILTPSYRSGSGGLPLETGPEVTVGTSYTNVEHVFTIPTTGSYEFGIVADDLSCSVCSASKVSVVATIYPP